MDNTSSIIKERLPLTGVSQSEIANMINVSPAQLTQYLNGNSSLNKDSLDKLLKIVGINLNVYSNRLILAKTVAEKLNGFSSDELVKMSKEEMINYTNIQQIRFYQDFTSEELKEIIDTMAYDYEDTFSFFKSLVVFYKESGNKENVTHTLTKNTWVKLAAIAASGILVGGIIGNITKGLILGKTIGNTITFNAMNKLPSLKNNLLSGFVDLAISMAKNKKQ